MLSARIREQANSCLRQAIKEARCRKQLSLAELAPMVGLSAEEYAAVEINPILVALPIIQEVMEVLDSQHEFMKTVNELTVIIVGKRVGQISVPTGSKKKA